MIPADTFEFLFLAAFTLAAIICAAVCLGAAVTALAAHKRARVVRPAPPTWGDYPYRKRTR